MLLNRRGMLSASVGAIAMGLSGCNSTRTTVVFVNHSSVALSIDASSGGKSFKKNNVQPGHSVQQVYLTNTPLGTMSPVTGTLTPRGMAAIALPPGAALTIGYKNTITVTQMGPAFIPSIVVS